MPKMAAPSDRVVFTDEDGTPHGGFVIANCFGTDVGMTFEDGRAPQSDIPFSEQPKPGHWSWPT